MAYFKRPTSKAFKWKILTTLAIVFARISMGCYYEMTGPTLPDLKANVNSNYEEVSRVLVAVNVAFLITSFVGGFLTDRFQMQVGAILAASQVIVAVATVSVPFVTNLWLLVFVFFVQGCGIGPMNSGGAAWIMWLWEDQSAAPINLFHWAFGIGAFIAPQLAKPFVSDKSQEDDTDGNLADFNNNSVISTTTSVFFENATENHNSSDPEGSGKEAQLVYPYSIAAGMVIVVSLLFTFLHFRDSHIRKGKNVSQEKLTFKVNTETKSLLEILSPGKACGGGYAQYGCIMVLLIFTYHFLVVGAERSWGKFVYSFAKDCSLRFSSVEAADLQSGFWFGFFSGRGLAFLVAKWTPFHIIVPINLALLAASSACLTIFAEHSPEALWVVTVAMGFLCAPLFPCAIVVYCQYVELPAMVFALSEGGAGFGGMLFQWMSGYLFEYHGPMSLTYFNNFYVAIVIVVYALIVIVGTRHQRMLAKLRQDNIKVDFDDNQVSKTDSLGLSKYEEANQPRNQHLTTEL